MAFFDCSCLWIASIHQSLTFPKVCQLDGPTSCSPSHCLTLDYTQLVHNFDYEACIFHNFATLSSLNKLYFKWSTMQSVALWGAHGFQTKASTVYFVCPQNCMLYVNITK
jgi:hypothetical protein